MIPIKVLIADDEEHNRETLKMLLSENQSISVKALCNDGFETIAAVQEHKPDLLFLDINMPRLNGFDVLELLGEQAPPVVFVTAYDEHALKAFETSAIDYVLKPVSRERLQKAIDKFIKTGTRQKKDYNPFLDGQKTLAAPLSRILVKDGPEIFIIPVNEIVYIKAEDDYIGIVTEKRMYLKQDRISFLESILDKSQFYRIHRSYILNINYLSKLESTGKDSYKAILKNGVSIPVSTNGFKELSRA
ncbi:MAG: response regulator transcription factor [Fibrobacter sp.]|nr:response regulator transcription factor [Fibrobacter sp.]